MRIAFLGAARRGARLLENENGFTVDDGGVQIHRNTWAVSLAGGIRFAHSPSVMELAVAFAELRSSELRRVAKCPTYLGGWYDRTNDFYCIDLTILIDDLDDALGLAEIENQDAIHNLATKESIQLSGWRSRVVPVEGQVLEGSVLPAVDADYVVSAFQE